MDTLINIAACVLSLAVCVYGVRILFGDQPAETPCYQWVTAPVGDPAAQATAEAAAQTCLQNVALAAQGYALKRSAVYAVLGVLLLISGMLLKGREFALGFGLTGVCLLIGAVGSYWQYTDTREEFGVAVSALAVLVAATMTVGKTAKLGSYYGFH